MPDAGSRRADPKLSAVICADRGEERRKPSAYVADVAHRAIGGWRVRDSLYCDNAGVSRFRVGRPRCAARCSATFRSAVAKSNVRHRLTLY
jgi:hypothetical protein